MSKENGGKTDAVASDSDDDRIVLINDTAEAREEFGENYTNSGDSISDLKGGRSTAFFYLLWQNY